MRITRVGLAVLAVSSCSLLAVRPGETQSVGSGGVSQSLLIYDEVDLHAFRNVLKANENDFHQFINNGAPISRIIFNRFATNAGGQRVYIGSVDMQPLAPGPTIPRLNYLYLYVADTPLPSMPPDRAKYYPASTVPVSPAPPPMIPSVVCFDFMTAVLGNPPPEVTDLLIGRRIVGLHSYVQSSSGTTDEVVLEINYTGGNGGPQSLPVTVSVTGICGLGSPTCGPWVVTVTQ